MKTKSAENSVIHRIAMCGKRIEVSYICFAQSLARHMGVVSALALLGLLSCSTTHYRESADREAYRVIGEKSPAVPGMDPHFSIDEESAVTLDDLPVRNEAAAFLEAAGQGEVGARIVSLETALAVAVQHNRDYQNEKEAVYLQALELTLDRHNYTPIFSGKLSGTLTRTGRDVTEVSPLAQAVRDAPGIVTQIGTLTGTPGDLLAQYADLVREAGAITGLDAADTKTKSDYNVEGNAGVGLDMLLKGGGRIAVDLTSNFLRFLTGDPRASATSALAASITQPLLRGAGRKIAAERLTQSERDLLYALRGFARFRQEFAVRICSSYYGVLQDRDTVRNNYQSYQAFKTNVERERALESEGKRTRTEVSRLEQALLSNSDSWIGSITRYKQRLDQFKIDLGLSADAPIILDDSELDRLKEKGIIHPNISSEDAVTVADTSRLDLYTERDREEDMSRKVVVAANALKPQLDVLANVTIPSRGKDRLDGLDLDHSQWNAGLNVDPGLDRKAERNSYRASLIAYERAKREKDLAEDQVKLEVRDAWRSLDQAKRSYEIAIEGVKLNERRVEEQDLLAELGKATALNRVDAQNDLTQAENNRTAALVGHTIARLEFWRDMGILFIKEDGQWEEITDVQQSPNAEAAPGPAS
jgi:outer membrane protein TolC